MSEIIDDLVRKLKRAEREAKKAQQLYDAAQAEARQLLKALEASRARVGELESAISLLRNGLKPKLTETGANVTPIKR